ncbi:MAG: nucleoside triphosphate pyrophosphohydrolase [Aestuariivita sp.]|nr:nucleoside triphosphate pyrophosphohydrolase [Aestuariivita sp.]
MEKDEQLNNQEVGIKRLLTIMRRLRDPKFGCPWDVEQTFATIAPYTIEEAYEVADAIEREDWDNLKNELGDLLLQSVFHAIIAEEKGLFSFTDIVNVVSEKMIERHPHVFTDESLQKTIVQQNQDWEIIKAEERQKKEQYGALDGVAVSLPALLRALKLQKRAATVGFDWKKSSDILNKITEESQELVAAADSLHEDSIEEEVGDLLFSLVNLARHLEINPENALRRTNEKFRYRFTWMEEKLKQKKATVKDCSFEELNTLWEQAKLSNVQEK